MNIYIYICMNMYIYISIQMIVYLIFLRCEQHKSSSLPFDQSRVISFDSTTVLFLILQWYCKGCVEGCCRFPENSFFVSSQAFLGSF